MQRLSGKTVLLTGGAGELGRETTILLLYHGARVIVTGRDEARLSAFVRDCQAQVAGTEERLGYVVMDGGNIESLRAAYTKIRERYSGIDVLINNAGSAGPKASIGELPISRDDRTDVKESVEDACLSLFGSVWLTTRIFRDLLNKNASVINVSTIFSKTEYFGRSAYIVPKAAVNSLSKVLAEELGQDERKIRVNTVLPGPIESQRIRGAFAAMDSLMRSSTGSTERHYLNQMLLKGDGEGRFLSKNAVANTILFLCSDESSSITGSELDVANGLMHTRPSPMSINYLPEISGKYFDGSLAVVFAGSQLSEALHFADGFRVRGATVLLLASSEELARVTGSPHSDVKYRPFDRSNDHDWQDLTAYIETLGRFNSMKIAVLREADYPAAVATKIEPSEIVNYLQKNVVGHLAMAHRLERLLQACEVRMKDPCAVTFVSSRTIAGLRRYADIEEAAIDALLHIWRNEFKSRNLPAWPPALHALTRYRNLQSNNIDLSWDWLCALSADCDGGHAGTISLDPSLVASSSGLDQVARRSEIHRNLHANRVALITGGSEGIGGEITRQLALAGARVVVAERSSEKLDRALQRLVAEMKTFGFRQPRERLCLIPACDVSKPGSLTQVVQQVIERFGKVDFLVNNAGLVGAEKMVVDVNPAEWRQTLQGNFISNYQLLLDVLPHMQSHGYGHVINMGSYFGGHRHGYVPYTNRADYAVSKAGQVALAELLAPFLGPQVQINGVSPGPVYGARLNGIPGRAGLYFRRSRLILENRRLNAVYAAVILCSQADSSCTEALRRVQQNEIARLLTEANCPKAIGELCAQVAEEGGPLGSAGKYLLSFPMYEQLIRRLREAGYKVGGEHAFHRPPEPFFNEHFVQNNADVLQKSMTERFALGRMPTDLDLAEEVVCLLAHRNFTGENMFPTGGFVFEGLRLGDSFRFDGASVGATQDSRIYREGLERLRQLRVCIFAGGYPDLTARIAALYLGQRDAGSLPAQSVTVVTGSQATADRLILELKKYKVHPGAVFNIEIEANRDLCGAFDRVAAKYGGPDVVISMSMDAHPVQGRSAQDLPNLERFTEFVEDNVTNHFLVAKKASLKDGCKIILVSRPIDPHPSPLGKAFSELGRTVLCPLTIAAGREAALLNNGAVFFQLDAESAGESLELMLLAMSTSGDDVKILARAA